MSIYDTPISALDGTENLLASVAGKVTLLVNVASKCGLTPQYEQLQALQERYADQGFSVVGIPCNQFLGQEPGTSEEIAEFCSMNYGVSFPMSEKVHVNGGEQHPLYTQLNATPDTEGHTGDIRWNFEKYLVGRDGDVIARFPPQLVPDDPEIVNAIEKALSA